MNINNTKFIFVLVFALTSTLFNIALAEEISGTTSDDATLTTEEAQALFDKALEERNIGKIYHSIEKFEYILCR